MKRTFALLFFATVSTSSFSNGYLDKFITYFGNTTPQTTVISPRVVTIEVTDDINFKDSAISLISAARRNDIHGVLLLINNNGGNMGSYSVIHDLVKKVGTIKPVVGLVTGSASSAGYLVASATNYLIAHSCSTLGNIGIVFNSVKYNEATVTDNNVEANLEVEVFTVGKYKALASAYRKLTDQDRDQIKQELDACYQQFLNLVAQNRSLSLDKYSEWAEAKNFLSDEALQLGLIDEIGTLFEAEQKLLELIRQQNSGSIFDDKIIYC